MKTYEITKDELKDLEPIAVGYKAVKYDGGTQQSFKYCNKGEKLVGRVFKVDGDLKACHWGLHFQKILRMYLTSMSLLDITDILRLMPTRKL